MGFVSEVWGVKQVAMDYREEDEARSLSIPGIAEAEFIGCSPPGKYQRVASA